MIVALIGFVVAGARALGSRSGATGLLIHLTLFAVFSAGYLKTEFPLRFALALVIVLLGVSAAFGDPSKSTRRRNLAIMLTLGSLVVAATVLTASNTLPGELDVLFRYLVVLPAAFVVGTQIAQKAVISVWIDAYRFWMLLFGVAAIVEFVTGRLFFEREGYIISLGTLTFRSLVLSEHSLGLATMLAAGVPYLWLITRRLHRVVALVVTGVAIWTTGSSGPMILFVLMIAALLLARVGTHRPVVWARMLRWGTTVVLLGLVLVGTVLAYNREIIVTSTTDAASAQYRIALYASVWPSLTERPEGWGVTGIPEGLLLIPTAGRIIDLARTIDSEFVLLTLEFGWIGLLVCFALVTLVFRPRALVSPVGQSALIITAAGFFLALHAWLGLGTLWLLQLGLLYAVSRADPGVAPASPAEPALGVRPASVVRPALRGASALAHRSKRAK